MKIYAGIGFVIFLIGAVWLYGESKFDAGYDTATNDHNKQVANISNHMLTLAKKQITKSQERINALEISANKQKAVDNEKIRSLLAQKPELKEYYTTPIHIDAVDLIYGPIRLQQTNN